MEKNSVADALIALATSDETRSQTARLRDIFDNVELALSAGVKRDVVLQSLNENGFSMNMKSFESALHRIRKERKNQAGLHNPNIGNNAIIGMHNPILAQAGENGLHKPTSQDMEQDGQGENLAGLSPREKREKKADLYVNSKASNPLLKNLKGK